MLIILDDEKYQELCSLFSGSAAIIISESALKEWAEECGYDLEQAKKMAHEAAADYNFGGDFDCVVDFVGGPEHYFLANI